MGGRFVREQFAYNKGRNKMTGRFDVEKFAETETNDGLDTFEGLEAAGSAESDEAPAAPKGKRGRPAGAPKPAADPSAPKGKRGRPAGAKNKPKLETSTVASEVTL